MDAVFAERYRAVAARDRRFDGQFVTAVSSTGIYCRPSCPARTPKAENLTFYLTSAAAHAAGYRACRRCLPEASPGAPEWNLRQDLAGRAMRLIRDGALNVAGVADLAATLGYSSRQVHRALVAELGAGPLSLARAHRAQTARALLVGTELSMADVAFAAGFTSVRQFNATIAEIFHLTPQQIRSRLHRSGGRQAVPGPSPVLGPEARGSDLSEAPHLVVDLALPVRHPFDAPGLFTFFAERCLTGVETAQIGDDLRYARTLRLPHGPGAVEVRANCQHGQWELGLRCELSSLADLPVAVARVRRMFDLDADPLAVDEALGSDPALGPLVAAVPGTRLPGTAEPEEYVVRAIVGQQISVAAARTHLTRLAELLGTPYASSFDGLHLLFPTPEEIHAGVPAPERLNPDRPLRLTARSITTVHAATSAISEGRLAVHSGVAPAELREQLLAIPGVGPWTAAYLALRVMSHPDDWMTGDVALVAGAKALRLLDPELPTVRSHRELEDHARQWAPWRSYAAMHLWRAASDTAAQRRRHRS